MTNTTTRLLHAIGLQGRDGLGEGGDAVVDAAPKVDEQSLIAVGNFGQGVDDLGHGNGLGHLT